MKNDLGKNEAGGSGNKSSAIMIISIIAVALFIGTALQPAIASPIPEVEVEEKEEECLLCRSRGNPAETKPECNNCLCTAFVAVDYGIDQTRKKIKEKLVETNGEVYDGILGDIVLWLVEGVAEGIVKSGFKIKFDKEELNETIHYYINKYVGPQGHDITKILVALQAISIGIRVYLISLCVEGKHILPISTMIFKFISKVLSEFLIKILLIQA